jgi:hypothetical protein
MRSISLNRSKCNPKFGINAQRGAFVVTQETSIKIRAAELAREKAETITDPKVRLCFLSLFWRCLADPKIQIINLARLLAEAEATIAGGADIAGEESDQAPIPKAPDANCGDTGHSPHSPRAPPGGHIADTKIPDESCKHIFPVAFRLGEAAAAKGPDGKTDFPANFYDWSTDRRLAFFSGYQAGMISASNEECGS